MTLNKYKLQRLGNQREEITQLLSLFNRAAFRPYEKGNGGDPTAILNAIWDTRYALATKGAVFLENQEAASFFGQLSDKLQKLDEKFQQKYPEVTALAYDWRSKPINTHERVNAVKGALGDSYQEAADFLRTEAVEIYDSPEKATEILNKLDAEIETIFKSDFSGYPIMEVIMAQYNIGSITNSIVNIDSLLEQVNQNLSFANSLDVATKQQLGEQIETLKIKLHELAQEQKDDAEAIAKAAKILVDEASLNQPNKKTVKISAEGLQKAAEGIAIVMPTVLSIVQLIFKITGIP